MNADEYQKQQEEHQQQEELEMSELGINEILNEIQTTLEAPKGQKNTFGNYNYRSCEDILNALKPHLRRFQATVTLTDDLVLIGDRYYVKATATLSNISGRISVTAFAREALAKKGMDESQITGSCSSYARKYALNGLFAVDDTKDADATNKHDDSDKVNPALDKFIADMKEFGDKGNWGELCLMTSEALWAEAWGKIDSHKKGMINKLTVKAAEYRDELNLSQEGEQQDKALELWGELNEVEKKAVWRMLAEPTKEFIRSIKE